jgi:hypothetical protein
MLPRPQRQSVNEQSGKNFAKYFAVQIPCTFSTTLAFNNIHFPKLPVDKTISSNAGKSIIRLG